MDNHPNSQSSLQSSRVRTKDIIQSQIPHTKYIQLLVPISYQVPPEFQNHSDYPASEDADRIAVALDLASHALQQLRTKSTQIQNETLYKELREQATADFEQRFKKLKQQAEEADTGQIILRKQLAELQQVSTQVRQEELWLH